ncbi:right-handed parallel beta-helix repeat-containing protein [Streptomyces sp. MBT62]|uniref:right-handed parallel beta-helix repeat-containing protein n=1 Tax=Streptomyces sp. MBT62 TaxID=2800410 RepID=UPI00190C4160|nr:right-handed parallel beta-helix repeat-containing protein [Streptomyces sp. MBT62]MBK3563857.1 right-handed parallel beta-helix repeat-containing protein [Streptomyces sp. MBT62]
MTIPHRHLRRAAGVIAATIALLGGSASAGASAASTSNAARPAAPQLKLYVSPHGAGTRCLPARPCGLTQAQQLVRAATPHARTDIQVVLAGGTYRLDKPLRFDARDSGRNGHTVSWVAAPGSSPILSGGSRVQGWHKSPGSATVWEAKVPRGLSVDPRQLYVDGNLATRARTQISPSDLSYTADGVDIKNSALGYLNNIGQQSRVEMEFVNSFTDRLSPVVSIADNHLTMAQPAWNNNTWGYDVVQSPFRTGTVYLQNAREFLDAPGEWYLDTATRTLYYQPKSGQDPRNSDVELPQLESLLQVSGTYTDPAHDLTFSGIRFTNTTWTGPSTAQGYADQQTGAFMYGASPLRPADAFSSCNYGCQTFESTRNEWHQTPGAVQISAANHITLTGNTYTNLGSLAVGVGEDANANASGVGLGASDITVSDSTFADNAGGGITVGGIQTDAHHPSDPAMTNKDITVSGNVIHDVAQQYQDQDGILFTYVTRARVTHNEVYNLPYSGIGAGWGWGIQDPGGSPDYAERGIYNYQPVYQTPTTAKDDVVSHNYIHDIMRTMNDGAGFYNLSASPGSVFQHNYLRAPSSSGLYFDEGSRYWTVDENVLDVSTPNIENTAANRNTGNITYTDNWVFNGQIVLKHLDTITGTVKLSHSQPLPAGAARVVYDSGIAAALRTGTDSDRPPVAVALTAARTGAQATITATLTNLDASRRATGVTATATAPADWTAKPTGPVPGSIAPGATATVTWKVTGPSTGSPIDTAAIATAFGYTFRGSAFTAGAPVTIVTATPVTTMSTFGSVPSVFGQVGDSFAIRNAGADIWGAGGQSDDEYGAIYSPKAAKDGSVVTVRVDTEDAVNGWTKAGIVLRNDLTQPRQSQGYVALVVTPDNGVNLDWDSDGGGLLDQYASVGSVKAPVWLRLTRTGDKVSAAYSTDGTTWNAVGGPVTLTGAAAQQDAGMIFTSHDQAAAGQAGFSHFTVN